MDLRKEIRQITVVLPLLLAVGAAAVAADQQARPTVVEQLDKSRITVQAFDKKGRLLRSGVGFIYDEDTIVCSYGNVRGASVLKVQTDGAKSYSNRLIAYNEQFDLAALKAEEEMTVNPPLGSSDMVAEGDSLFFYSKQKRNWRIAEASVKNFVDSGNGYEVIRLKALEQEKVEPSPVFNSAGKVVAWLNGPSTALPLEAIAGFLIDRSASISITQATDSPRLCNIKKTETLAEAKGLDTLELQTLQGRPPFTFAIDMPRDWKYFRAAASGRYIVRAADEETGACIELRVMPEQTDDLQLAVERSETLFASGLTRSSLVPFSGETFSGLRADYVETDPDSEFDLIAYYTMSKSNFYVLAARYPAEYAEEMRRLIDQIISSLKI